MDSRRRMQSVRINSLLINTVQKIQAYGVILVLISVVLTNNNYCDGSAVSKLQSSTNNFHRTILVKHPSRSDGHANATVDLLERRQDHVGSIDHIIGSSPARSGARGLFSAFPFKLGGGTSPPIRRSRPRYTPVNLAHGPGPSGIPLAIHQHQSDYSPYDGELLENFLSADGPTPASSIFPGPAAGPQYQQHHHHHHIINHDHSHNHADLDEQVTSSPPPHTHSPLEKELLHPCYRPCSSEPGSLMTCTYDFVVANYFSLSPHCYECPNVTIDCFRKGCLPVDGRPRALAVVNKQMPGPGIRVCQGDTVVVTLQNRLVGQETIIHWHGLHQAKTPWMDGVPHLTQCPIPQGTSFRYQFEVPDAGTQFWHSHDGLQRADGVFGSLIVRKPIEEDFQSQHYDFDLAEHEIIVMDWLYNLAIEGHLVGHVTDMREMPRSILVNGQGFPPAYFDDFRHYDTIQSRRKPFVPIHQARIRQGYAYRFRLISNGVALCPIEFSIENHPLLVIASDGNDLTPALVNSLVIHAGERWDFVVRGDAPPGSYWMKYRGQIDCNATRTFQLGVLNYDDMPYGALPRHTIRSWEAAGPQLLSKYLDLNPVNVAPGVPGESVTIAELSSTFDDDPEILTQEYADHQFYLSYDFNPVPNVNFGKPDRDKRKWLEQRVRTVDTYLPQLNFISHAMPLSPPLIQPETINSIDRCNAESKHAQGIDCTKQHCQCTHWLKVELNSIVEIVLVDMGVTIDAAHPFHLHGHSFRVMALEKVGNTTTPQVIQQWDAQGLLPRRRVNAPIKDTVYVPDGGYTIIRFRANNPGFWFFHCHLEFHTERGMAVIFQVGNKHEIPRPPTHFPKCGNYLPPITPAYKYKTAGSSQSQQYSTSTNAFTSANTRHQHSTSHAYSRG